MLELNYIGEKTKHKVDFDLVSEHIVKIIGTLNPKTKGFTLSREGEEDNWDYSAYTTVYQQLEGEIWFSRDGSVRPLPKVYFHTGTEGTLNGEVQQEAKRYEQLVVPTVQAGENYEFTGWVPEIPGEGEISSDKTFVAQFRYIPTLPEVQERKVEEMNALQLAAIQQGIDVRLASGHTEHFTLKDQDQTSLMGLQTQVAIGQQMIPWHTSDEAEHCKFYSNADMALITTAAMAYVTWHVTYFRDLRIYIRGLTSKEEVEAVTYGMDIPEEYQSDVLKALIAQRTQGEVAG